MLVSLKSGCRLQIPEVSWSRSLLVAFACTDVHILRGEYLGEYPVIPGHELAGEVVAVGERVSRFRAGDRVAVEPNIACDNCYNCLNNRQNFA